MPENLSQIKQTLKQIGIRPSKRLGQNFLCDKNICHKVVCCLDNRLPVLEIGAGLGMLTSALCEKKYDVTAVEYDRKLYEWLCEKFKGDNFVRIVFCDILKFNTVDFAKQKGGVINIIGNIPYSISSPLIFQIIKNSNFIEKAVLTLQKEVAERLISKPSKKSYGRLSVMFQYRAYARHIMNISSSSFYPIPKVDSGVLEIGFYKEPRFNIIDEGLFFKVVKLAFLHRRKMLLNTLKGSFENITEILKQVDVNPQKRAEELSVEDFVKISNKLVQKNSKACG
ncbi:ribosomal RNA small subunit methyltransferase A [bacterium Unc6]|nr:ribosomal RNA small subunit methyltransferase A [bacterium Unc6]